MIGVICELVGAGVLLSLMWANNDQLAYFNYKIFGDHTDQYINADQVQLFFIVMAVTALYRCAWLFTFAKMYDGVKHDNIQKVVCARVW